MTGKSVRVTQGPRPKADLFASVSPHQSGLASSPPYFPSTFRRPIPSLPPHYYTH